MSTADHDPAIQKLRKLPLLGRAFDWGMGPAAVSAAPGLVSLLAEPDTRSRVVAATALKRIGRGAVPALVEGLQQGDPDMHERIASLLNCIAPNDEEVAAAIRDALTEDDPGSLCHDHGYRVPARRETAPRSF